jgi:choice-of-anchor A domain-containing protein/LPXTG-motif cell wall-anchored protein
MIRLPEALLTFRLVGIKGRTITGTSTAIAMAATLGLCGAGNAFAATANGRSAACPTAGSIPGIGHSPLFTDNNVALFAGGDYTVDGGAAEAEGLLVVKGKATFAKNPGGVYNVGRVGAGSGILPTAGDVMLAVGGDVAIAKGTTVDVGSGLTAGPRYGGSVQVGGNLDVKGELRTNGGASPARMGAAGALGAYNGFDATMAQESASLGALRPTGTSVRAGGTVTFTSTAPSAGNIQVFEIAAADLDKASTFLFQKIPAGASVLVNVTGNRAVSISPMSVGFNDDRVDVYTSKNFGEAASRILYNFRESPTLTLGGGGNFMGSILAPKANADLTASTNGRLYVGGNVKTHGSGNESHNYPWSGSPAFACKPEGPGQPVPPPTEPAKPGQPSQPAPPGQPTPPRPSAPAGSLPPGQPSAPAGSPGATPSESAPPAPDNGGSLAQTGGSGNATTIVAGAAAVALAGGAALFVIARRRRRV